MSNPLAVRGVVDLAGPLDLTTNIDGHEGLCRDRVATNLMGGTPDAMPERYAQASPMKLLPLGVLQVVVLGEYEEYVSRHFAQAYVQAAERAGDRVRMILIPGAGHFEIASPESDSGHGHRVILKHLLAQSSQRLPDTECFSM